MKLERLHESLLASVVLVGGLSLAVAAGSMAGSGKMGMAGMIMGAIALLTFTLILRERVWMLIPATAMLGGTISVLPLPFNVSQLAVFFAFGVFLLLKAFKIVRIEPKWGLVEVWMLVVLIYLATVFIRNPVGVEALGSERVGGRPYFNVVIACIGFWVLSRAVATKRDAFFVPLLVVAGNAFVAAVNIIAYRFPPAVGPISALYSGLAVLEEEAYGGGGVPGGDSTRLTYWQGVASSTFLAACSFWRPLTIINPLYLGRFLVFLFAIFAVFVSGFRSTLFAMMLVFLISSYFRSGLVQVFKAIMLAVAALVLLLMMQGTVINLPHSAQRALSFLPGKWDHAAKSDAAGSTEWRVEMWKAMLFGDRYIANKWLGDGFGFTRQQLQIMKTNTQGGVTHEIQENFLISGSVHSGPVSTIRFVGYVGLALFLVLLVLVAMRSVQLIRRAQGTPFYSLALFVGIPAIMHPFVFTFIFGAYDGDLPTVIFSIGMLKMLENSLDSYDTKITPVAAAVQPIAKFRRPPQFAPVR